MAFFGLFKDKRDNLDESAREEGAKTRQENAIFRQKRRELELKNLELEHKLREKELNVKLAELDEKLASLEGDDYDDEPQNNNIEDMLLMTLLSSATKQPTSASTPSTEESNSINSGVVSFSDDDIKKLIREIPKAQLKIADKLSDNALKSIIRSKVGKVDDDTMTRALVIFREKLY